MSDFSSFTGKFRARSRLRVINAGNLNFDAIEISHAAAVSKEMMQRLALGNSRQPSVEGRLTHLESLVKNLMWNQASAPSDNDVISPELSCYPVENVVQTQSEKVNTTRYVGSTHWSAILDDIHELKVVLGGYADVQEAEKLATPEAPALGRELIFGSSIGISRCTSRRQYREFWADTASVNPLWLSMLFSICSTDSNHSPQTDLVTESSKFHTASGHCLVIGEYHRSQQFACKNLRTLDPSREAGAILGIVVRMAYEMGYHRDPDSFGFLTAFEREMRRRLWAACKQMDVMISFQLGLPSNICLENCDTKSPRNLLDSDFDVDTQVLPASRSENEATRLLWFIVKDRQLISFSKVCKDTLSFKEKSEAEILQLDEEIRQMYKTIPDILRTRPLSESIADAPFSHNDQTIRRIHLPKKSVCSTSQIHAPRQCIMVLCLVVHTHRKRGSRHPAIDSATEREVLPLLEQSYDICVEKSQVSRDARRVSHAVRLILNGTKTSNAPESRSGGDNAPGIDIASRSLQPEHGNGQGNVTPFDLLDPFNFMGNDFENIDWSEYHYSFSSVSLNLSLNRNIWLGAKGLCESGYRDFLRVMGEVPALQ
ncbi:hypothetical protein V1527DRAFT_521821 [Lipomyces starkeyi]